MSRWDWDPGPLPASVVAHPEAFITSAESFIACRGRPGSVRIARQAAVYPPTFFDVGPDGQVEVEEYALLNGPLLVAEGRITIGHHALLAWDVVVMDTSAAPRDTAARAAALVAVAPP